MSFVHTNLFRFIFPLLTVAILLAGFSNVSLLAQTNVQLTLNLPYFFFAVCILLCQGFNQGRIGMVAMAMSLTYYLIQSRLQVPLTFGTTKLEYLLIAFTLPVACIVASLYSECRLFTLRGISYLIFLLFLLCWGLITITEVQESGISEFWHSTLFSIPWISNLPILIILYSSFITLWYGIRVLKGNQAIDVAIYSCLCISLLTFVFIEKSFISSVLFSLCGVLLVITIMTTSHELAYIDQLTGIPGRRALETEMRHLGKRYSIAMLDVDHFKQFNDTYGHDTGDEVLKLVASRMTKIKGKARIFRYGGEEFTVLFKGKYADQVVEFLEELRESIADYAMTIRDKDNRPKNNRRGEKKRRQVPSNKTVNITISIGVADSYETRKPEQVRKQADEALYRAKNAGRNCVSA